MRSVDQLLVLVAALTTCCLAGRPALAGSKIDCHPLDGATEDKCRALGCVWEPLEGSKQVAAEQRPRVDEPWCRFPDNYTGYKLLQTSGNRLHLKRVRPSIFQEEDVKELIVNIEQHSEGNLVRVKIYDANQVRFEPELPHMNWASLSSSAKRVERELRIELGSKLDEPGRLIIRRASTGAILFSTDLGKLIFADKFLQLNTELDSPLVYGLGEHFDSFLKWSGGAYKVYSFYNTDQLMRAGGHRSYGGFPFYVNLDSPNQTQAHGVYLRNSNAMDVVLQTDQSVTFRPIGGIFDFAILVGPSANDVVSQFQHLVGLPDLPPRWALGFHLCRYNYGSLEKVKLVWRRTREAGIPFDVQWNDIDYMDGYNDFTYDRHKFEGLPQFVGELHRAGMHYMILFDPGLSQEANYYPYQLAEQMDVLVKNISGKPLVGKVWNRSGRTVFPDFSNLKSHELWSKLFERFHSEIQFDGAWVDMNDISNFVDGSLDGCPQDEALERPPYVPDGTSLQHHSLCLTAQHFAGSEYDLHNRYSFYEAIATRRALERARPGKRSLIISRSTSAGQGHFGGHWSGDVLSTWDYLRWSVPALLEHSLYGFSMMGTDICGFAGNTNPQLCARWSTLGAFYSFSRNHNDDVSIDQDPVALGPEVVKANRNAYLKRYSLLPYLYSLLHRAHRFGEPFARSVPFEFHASDKEALRVEYQFLLGRALMVSPVVDENVYWKDTFLPEGRWYETNIVPEVEGLGPKVPKMIDSNGTSLGWFKTENISLADLPLFYRGGHIVPVYFDVKQTTSQTAQQPIGLEIALCPMMGARGELYLDDGESIEDKHNLLQMRVANSKLEVRMSQEDYRPEVEFGRVKIFGLKSKVNNVTVDSKKSLPFAQHDHLVMFDLNATPVSKNKPLLVEWS